MIADLRIALRQLFKTPGFTVTAVLTLALGIGACTALFSVIDAVLLRPLPYPGSESIVTVWSLNTQRGSRYQVSGPDFRDWQAGSRSFSALAKYYLDEQALVANGRAEKIAVASVSEGFLPAMGIAVGRGRSFTAREWRQGGGAMVSAEFARHFFPDRDSVLGAPLKLYGHTFPIVGVLPAGFDFPGHAGVWLPVDTLYPESTERSAHNYRVLGRLAPGITLAQAQSELSGIAQRLEQAYPGSNTHAGAAVIPLQDYLVRNHRATLWVMFGAVGVLLLIACTNVANLLLARGAARAREVALRAALGASSGRIVRGLLAESVVLSALAGLAGLLLAAAGLRLLVTLAPADIPRLDQASLDFRTLLFAAVAVALVCGLAGLVPALQSARTDLRSALGASGRGVTGGAGRLRSGFVVAQVGMSLVLLTGAGLLLRSFQLLSAVDTGYYPEKVLVMDATYPASDEAGARQGTAYFTSLLRETRALPGVVAVSAGGGLPVDQGSSDGLFQIEGRSNPAPADAARQQAGWRVVAPDYFSTLGIRVLRGREFDPRDVAEGTPAVLVNETLARATWPGEDPVGHRIRIGWDSANAPWMTIVGVVADTRQITLDAPIGPELYVPFAQHPLIATELKVIARTAGEPTALAEAFRRASRQLNAEVPVKFTTAELLIADTLTAPRFRALLIGVFATVAVVLAVVGVASVLAFVVTERRREIGVRLAIGAPRHRVLTLILGNGLKLVLAGVVLGLAGAAAASRFLQSLLFNVPALDPVIYAGVSLLLLGAAALACLIPALIATTVDPMTVLRAD